MIRLLRYLIEDFLRPLSGPIGIRLRRMYYRKTLAACGKGLVIGPNVRIENPHCVRLGDHVWLDQGVALIAGPPGDGAKIKRLPAADDNDNSAERGYIAIGNNAHIGLNAIIQGHGGVQIGDYFTCSANCAIYSYSNDPYRCRQGTVALGDADVYYVESPVSIGHNCWLGLSVSLVGAEMGDDSFALPNSLVIGRVAANSVVRGFPAIHHRDRFSDASSSS